MEITEKTVCRFFTRRSKKKRKEAQKTIRDIGPTQRTINPDILEKIGAKHICSFDRKNHFVFPLRFLMEAFSRNEEIKKILRDINGKEMPLGEAVEQIKKGFEELFQDTGANIKIEIDFAKRIIFLNLDPQSPAYHLFYFEPVE